MNEASQTIRRQMAAAGVIAGCLLITALYLHVRHLDWFRVDGTRPSTTILFVWLTAAFGGIAAFTAVPRLAPKMSPLARRTAVGVLAAWACGCLVLAGLVVHTFSSRAGEIGCELGMGVAADAKRTLGDAPNDLGVFVPDYPFSPLPDDDALAALNEYRHATDDTGEVVRYSVPGFTVQHSLSVGGGWGSPAVAARGMTLARVEKRWGPSTSTRWTAGELHISYGYQTTRGCEHLVLRLERISPASELLGPRATQPLGDFEVAILGKTPRSLGIPDESTRQTGDPNRVRVMLNGASLELALGDEQEIEGWRLTFPEHTDATLELFEERFGPGVSADPEQKGAERWRSTDRVDLFWGKAWDGTLSLTAGRDPTQRRR